MLKLISSIVVVLILVLLIVFPKYSIAELQSIDDSVYGVDSITYDTETGLEWLDLHVSIGMTFSEVSDEIGPGLKFESWRRATWSEVLELMCHANSDYNCQDSDLLSYEDGIQVVEMLRPTYTDSNGKPAIRAYVQPIPNRPFCFAGPVTTFFNETLVYYYDWLSCIPWEYSMPDVAHWLVRDATPGRLVKMLMNTVHNLNLSSGISNSLSLKLSAVFQALEDANEKSGNWAINKLQVFINSVEALRLKHISDADADSLIMKAQQIIDMLSF